MRGLEDDHPGKTIFQVTNNRIHSSSEPLAVLTNKYSSQALEELEKLAK